MKLTSAYIIGCITAVTAESLEESSRGSLITKVEKAGVESVDCDSCKCTIILNLVKKYARLTMALISGGLVGNSTRYLRG